MNSDPTINRFEALLAAGHDNALLRLTLGQHHLKAGQGQLAATHLASAVEQQPALSAAWKFLGKALAETGDLDAARAAYRQGIAVAQANGDQQLVKEMGVFVRRLDKAQTALNAP